ncbi:MAG: hypothetical protein H7336_08605 [Bacteriovorax sp.]|nr:hypothetical protein [Bacteriovorax sp.]
MKMLSILILGLFVSSCGKKVIMKASPMSGSSALTMTKEFKSDKVTDDVTCIDNILVKDLGEKEIVKKIVDDSDISFCNGLRIRIKVFKISSGEIRVYGFAESSSGRTSCLKQGSDFDRVPLLGDQGTLVGDKITITLGGHSMDSNGKVVKSDHLKGKFVRFDGASYSGEIGFYEGAKLKCWAQH